jgi:hypothetical protein
MLEKLLFTISMACIFNSAQAETIPQAPFFATCNQLESGSFSRVFANIACEREFSTMFATASPEDAVIWLRGHRGCVREFAHFSWLAATVIDPKLQRLSWLQQLTLIGERLFPESTCSDGVCDEKLITALLNGLRGQSISAETIKYTSEFLDVVEQDQKFKPMMDKAYNAIAPICTYHSSIACSSAMKWLLDQMYPHSYSTVINGQKESFTFSMLPSYRKIFTDDRTQDLLIAAALDVLKLVQHSNDGNAPHATFFEIMTARFSGEETRMWDAITVLATRGAAWATATAMVRHDNRGVFAALMILSAAMSVLDQPELNRNSAWSYSEDTQTTCYQPKSYHFWMAASFAWHLQSRGHSQRTALLVSILLGAMYETGSTTYGREPDDVFFVPTFATIVNRARRELTHQRLGARFGVEPKVEASIKFDDELELFLSRSKSLPEVSAEEMKELISSPLKRWQLWTSLMGFYDNTAVMLSTESQLSP